MKNEKRVVEKRKAVLLLLLSNLQRQRGRKQSGAFLNFLPYGYRCVYPRGENVLMLPVAGENVCVGCQSKPNSALKEGEIEITAKSGACIRLKNNGSVVINGLEINKNGEIKEG